MSYKCKLFVLKQRKVKDIFLMSELNLKTLNDMIEDFKKAGKNPDKLEIGYKTYTRLIGQDKFFDQVTKSDDSLTRFYRGIKIKLVAEKHFLAVK